MKNFLLFPELELDKVSLFPFSAAITTDSENRPRVVRKLIADAESERAPFDCYGTTKDAYVKFVAGQFENREDCIQSVENGPDCAQDALRLMIKHDRMKGGQIVPSPKACWSSNSFSIFCQPDLTVKRGDLTYALKFFIRSNYQSASAIGPVAAEILRSALSHKFSGPVVFAVVDVFNGAVYLQSNDLAVHLIRSNVVEIRRIWDEIRKVA